MSHNSLIVDAAYAAREFSYLFPWPYAHGQVLPPLCGSTRTHGEKYRLAAVQQALSVRSLQR